MRTPYKLSEDTFDNHEIKAVKKLLDSKEKLTYGKYVKKLEKKIALINKRKFCVMVNSGSSANLIGVSSLIHCKKFNLKKGDEVIVPSLSWSTTYSPLIQNYLKLVFVDIDLKTLNINENIIEKAISKKTKAIFVANILGQSCNFQKISKICKRHKINLMVDNCESFLSKHNGKLSSQYGIFSTISSFFSHHFSTIEGGYILTDDFEVYCNALSLRSHGWIREQPHKSKLLNTKYSEFEKSYKFVLPGYNLRPNEINAILGLEQIKKVRNFIKSRRKNAIYFYNLFKNTSNCNLPKFDIESSFFAFAIILKENIRNKVLEKLKQSRIETRPIVSGNIVKNKMIKKSNFRIFEKLTNSEKVDKDGIMIGNRSFPFNKNEKKALMNLKNIIESF